jgi:hypothetical protein
MEYQFYESTIVEKHFQSKKSQAIAYLMAIGAKALVVSEALLDDDENLRRRIKSFDEESEIKRQIQQDEIRKKFQHNLSSYTGVYAFKRGRNGSVRKIQIQICHSLAGDTLTWKSRLLGQKSFKLDTIKSVEEFKESFQQLESNSKRKSSILPPLYIRLLNDTRPLELQFFSKEEVVAFTEIISFSYLRNKSSSSSSTPTQKTGNSVLSPSSTGNI